METNKISKLLKEPICPPHRYSRYVRITLLPYRYKLYQYKLCEQRKNLFVKHKVDNKEEKDESTMMENKRSPFSHPNLTNDTLKERQED